MKNSTGTFSVEDAFRITGRGWVLVGDFEGNILPGYRLDFGNDLIFYVTGVDFMRKLNNEKIGLLIRNQFESRQELIDLNIMGTTAQILK